jgi:hypothetical protein
VGVESVRRILVALAIVAGVLVPMGSFAAAPPALAGDNTLKATGSRVVTVSIPKKLGVTWYDPIWNGAVTTNGTYAGYALAQITPRKQGRIIMVMQLRHPAGCRQDGSSCTPIRVHYLKGPNDTGRINMSAGMTTTLEAGTYNLYGFTDPGKALVANVELKGLLGKKTWTATSAATMSLVQSVTPVGDVGTGVGAESKKLSGRLANRGLVIGGVWATPSNGVNVDDPGAMANGGATLTVMTHCWEKKTAADDRANACGFGSDPAAAQPDPALDNLGRGAPLFSWRSTGEYSYAYNVIAAAQPLGRYGGYAMWWATG